MPVLNAVVTPPHTGCAYLDEPGTVLAFAHRGGDATPEIQGLENTLTAFRHAVSLGYTYLETDVHATRDGVLLAFHDSVLDRVTDRTGEIALASYAEVKQARIGGIERIPTLAELFDACPDACFNIDIKTEAATRPLVDFLAARNVEDRVLVGCWSRRRLNEFRRLTGGRVATSATPAEVALFMLLPARMADRLTGRHVRALQIPHRRGPLTIASARLVRRMHAIGKHVHVWTIDDPAEMTELLDLGVDGLMTDRTDILKAVLQARGQWREDR
jgi:glycerophosphoryl diester phosphodiesterase